jgi:hypothetical protein
MLTNTPGSEHVGRPSHRCGVLRARRPPLLFRGASIRPQSQAPTLPHSPSPPTTPRAPPQSTQIHYRPQAALGPILWPPARVQQDSSQASWPRYGRRLQGRLGGAQLVLARWVAPHAAGACPARRRTCDRSLLRLAPCPQQVRLTSSDNQMFEVEEEVANESQTVKNMIEGAWVRCGAAPRSCRSCGVPLLPLPCPRAMAAHAAV